MNHSLGITAAGLLILYGFVAFLLLGTEGHAFDHLHIALDTSAVTLSGIFAVFLWGNVYARKDAGCRRYLTVVFALVSVSEAVHTLFGLEWAGSLAWIMDAGTALRPATWPPSTYFLPLAMALALSAAKRKIPLAVFATASFALLVGLYEIFLALPSYVATGIAGIQRPFQIPVLPLLAGAAYLYWQERENDPLFPPLIACTLLLFISDTFMLWSASPHDKWAMAAHFGKLLAYLMAHGAMVKITVDDALARNRAETELHAAFKDLQAKETKFRQLIESAPDAIVVADAGSIITVVNRRTEILFGYCREELLGQRIEILIPPATRDSHAQYVQGFLRRPHDRDMGDTDNFWAMRKDGREFPIDISLSPLQTETGAIVVAAIRDISERKALELELADYRAHLELLISARTSQLTASETRFRNLVEQSLVGICIIEDGRYRYVNPALVAMAGYASSGCMMELDSIRNRVTPADWQRISDGFALLMAGELKDLRLEYASVRSDGIVQHIEGHASLCEFEGKPAIMAILLDVTERKEAERKLQRLNADLERRVEERTAELVALNQELQAFTYAASHDLKSPLRAINSFSSLLENRYRSQLEGDGLLFLDFIRRGATRMTLLIDDLLAYARIDQGSGDVETVDGPAAVQAILADFQEEIRQSGTQVRTDLPAGAIQANPSGLSQVLRNLVGNALKFSAKAQPPVIDIRGRIQDGNYVIQVRDNGIGFDMADHARIFEIFHRLHTYDEYQGTGVGLALVKKAMDRMGGRVWAESAPGQGATFYLQLPLATP